MLPIVLYQQRTWC